MSPEVQPSQWFHLDGIGEKGKITGHVSRASNTSCWKYYLHIYLLLIIPKPPEQATRQWAFLSAGGTHSDTRYLGLPLPVLSVGGAMPLLLEASMLSQQQQPTGQEAT